MYRIACIATRLYIRRHPTAWRAFDELLSAAGLGASQARAGIRPGTNATQARAFVLRRAQGAIIDDLRSRNPGSRSEHRPAPVLHLEDLDTDVRATGRELEQVEARAIVAAALAGLTDRERRVLIATTGQGHSLAEVATALGVTESRISQIRTAALAKARQAAA